MSTLSAPGKVEMAGLGPVRAEVREAGHATLRRLLRLRWGVGAAIVLLLIVATSVFATWIAPHDPLAVDIRHRLAPPGWRRPRGWTAAPPSTCWAPTRSGAICWRA